MASTHELVRNLGAVGLVWPDRVSSALALGKPLAPAQRATWQRVVRDAYGAMALKAGFAIFGRDLTLADLAHLSQEAPAWLARVTEGAGLAPLLVPFVKIRQAPPANFQGLRNSALARGLTALGWKWLWHQRPKTVSKLFAFGWTAEATWWANLLAKAKGPGMLSASWVEPGRPYLQQSAYEWVLCCHTAHDRHTANLHIERLFRLVPAEATAQHLAEFELVSGMFFAGLRKPENRISVAPGRTWGGVLESVRRANNAREARAQQLALAREQAAGAVTQSRAPGHNEAWTARLGSGCLHQVQVTELLTKQALADEGSVMEHCVGDGGYLLDCVRGQHVVMGLREPLTNARATLQLVKAAGANVWQIGQLAGPSNSPVPQVFWKVARSLAIGVKPVADKELLAG